MADETSVSAARDAALSRTVSHALRHEPWVYELELDEEGWTPIGQLLVALGEVDPEWSSLDRESLARRLARSPKKRHEIDGNRIRALYGHSVSGRVAFQPADPPTQLFHGTAPDMWSLIKDQGLLPMARQYVHLSVDTDTALTVGRRKSAHPVLLEVAAAAAAADGVQFFVGNGLVWLAEFVPSVFISPVATGHLFQNQAT